MKQVISLLALGIVAATGCFACKVIANPQNITAASGDLWQVVPKRVHDGDTFRVSRNGEELKIRSCGIDAPELKQPLGEASRDYLRSLLNKAGNQVRLKIVDRDRYGRQVAEVFTPDGNLIQEQQARAGMVYVYQKYIHNCPEAQAIIKAEAAARQQRLGVWAKPNAIPPWEWRRTHQ
ncbi:hypothetical protein DO97_10910 [Neosynechococcus sphagnicola sy1]|uniref:TNase-like domain-containing protein n=1 Tax=Neosynechococcus sphagnicola sy1 TaxID=1497020 RepID=A0A098TN37_9CYAN|nr:thermonuclease family protein [Neosynechococcus sphagnicola]KGF72258.1 hypothetical protein DO97_10910 [Neosynechococcus sphagnicola sy1]